MGKGLNGKELGKGICQRKDGRYEARIYNPGTQKYVSLYDTNLQRLKKTRNAYLEGKGHGIAGYDLSITVSQWYGKWMELYIIHNKKDSKCISVKQSEIFFDACKDTRYYELFYLLLNTGIRIGEACALTWRDIDFDNELIYINKTLNQVSVFYDKEGNLIVSHKSLLSENGFPLSFSISNDGEKMMTSYLSIKEGSTENQVIFYNFSNVGKDEVDRVVGTFNQYGETIVPAVYFVSNEDAIAIGDNVLTIYKMKEKPTIRKEIKFDKEIQKVFYNEKYVGLIFENSKGDTPYKMEVYSLSGEKIMSKEIEMNLDHVKFAGKNVLMYDDVTCELISLKGVAKFKHVFTKQLDAIVPMESTNTFLLMTKNKIEEISLK